MIDDPTCLLAFEVATLKGFFAHTTMVRISPKLNPSGSPHTLLPLVE